MGILNIASKEKMEELILLQQIRDLASHGEDSFVYEDNETMAKLFSNKEAMNNTVSGSRLFKYGVSKGLHAGKALALIDDIGIANWASLATPEDILNDSSAFNEVFANTRAFKYMRSTGLLEYIPIDYIESNGAQYIKTGWMYGSTNYTGCKIRFESELGLSDGKTWVVTGCGSGTNLYVGLNQNNKIYYGNGGSDVDTGVTYNGNKCIFELDLKNKTLTVTDSVSGTVYVNVSNITLATPSRTSQEFFLFAYSNTSDQAMMHTEKLYMYQIYENDTLVRDFVPAKDFNGVICLYDKVTKQFFYNAGTGDFLYDHTHDYGDTWLYNETHHWKACACGNKEGLNIHGDDNIDGLCDTCGYRIYYPMDYLQATGTQYINTGYKPTSNSKIEMKVGTSNGNFYSAIHSTSRHGVYVVQGGRIDMAFGGTGYVGSAISGLTEPITLTLENGLLTANGQSYTFTEQADFTIDYGMPIFGDNSSGTYRPIKGECYYYKIYESDVLMMDLIPVLDINKVPCMYDKVSGRFLYNSGTGQFAFSCINHSISDTYNYDMTTHWNECEVCGEKFNVADHVDSNGDNICDICGGSTLPYIPVEYVTLDTGAVINTGIDGTSQETYELDCQIYSSTSSNRFLMYSVHDNYDYDAGMSIQNSTIMFRSLNRYGEYNLSSKIRTGEYSDRMVIKHNMYKGYAYIDDEQVATWTADLTSACDGKVFLGAKNKNGGNATTMRIYACKIYTRNTSLLADFIPAIDANGTACLYDKVSGTFFYNANTTAGTITAGPEV